MSRGRVSPILFVVDVARGSTVIEDESALDEDLGDPAGLGEGRDPGEFTVTEEHLNGSAPTVKGARPGGSGFNPFMLAPTHESVTVVGVELPEPGC